MVRGSRSSDVQEQNGEQRWEEEEAGRQPLVVLEEEDAWTPGRDRRSSPTRPFPCTARPRIPATATDSAYTRCVLSNWTARASGASGGTHPVLSTQPEVGRLVQRNKGV